MDPDAYREALENSLWDGDLKDVETTLGIRAGHADIHIRTDAAGIERETAAFNALNRHLDNLIEGAEVSADGEFFSLEDAIENIRDAAIFKIDEIASWAQSGKNEFNNIKDYHVKALTVNLGKDVVAGSGLTSDFKEKESGVIRLVLKRDYSADAPYGFHIKTAYVDINDKSARETGLSFTKEDILSRKLYDLKTPLQSAALAVYHDNPNISTRYFKEESTEEHLFFKQHSNGPEQYYARANNENVKFIRATEEGRTRLTLEQARKECPELCAVVEKAVLYRDAERGLRENAVVENALDLQEKCPEPVSMDAKDVAARFAKIYNEKLQELKEMTPSELFERRQKAAVRISNASKSEILNEKGREKASQNIVVDIR